MCHRYNFCQFQKNIYQFCDSLPMGFPLASPITDIFMYKFQSEIFDSDCMLTNYIKYWYRYMDDILCTWTSTISEVQDFLTFINSLHPSINSP